MGRSRLTRPSMFGPQHHVSPLPLRLVLFNMYRYLGSERLRYFPKVKQLEVLQDRKPGSGFSIFTHPQCPLQIYHRVGIWATGDSFVRQEGSEESHPPRGLKGHGLTWKAELPGVSRTAAHDPLFPPVFNGGGGSSSWSQQGELPISPN